MSYSPAHESIGQLNCNITSAGERPVEVLFEFVSSDRSAL